MSLITSSRGKMSLTFACGQRSACFVLLGNMKNELLSYIFGEFLIKLRPAMLRAFFVVCLINVTLLSNVLSSGCVEGARGHIMAMFLSCIGHPYCVGEKNASQRTNI